MYVCMYACMYVCMYVYDATQTLWIRLNINDCSLFRLLKKALSVMPRRCKDELPVLKSMHRSNADVALLYVLLAADRYIHVCKRDAKQAQERTVYLIYIYIYIYIHIYTYTHTDKHTQTHTHARTQTHIYIHGFFRCGIFIPCLLYVCMSR